MVSIHQGQNHHRAGMSDDMPFELSTVRKMLLHAFDVKSLGSKQDATRYAVAALS
jgi:hypothetical protein